MADESAPQLCYLSEEAMRADVETLAVRLEESDWRPDYLVGIGRGGLVPAVYLSHRIGVSMLSVDYSTQLPPFAEALIAAITERAAAGERFLFVDDINDSGATIAAIRALVAKRGEAEVRFAALIDNCRSRARIDYRAGEIDRAEDKRWFVFPWEAMAPRDALVEEAASVPDRLA